jgi:hypothetical protein
MKNTMKQLFTAIVAVACMVVGASLEARCSGGSCAVQVKKSCGPCAPIPCGQEQKEFEKVETTVIRKPTKKVCERVWTCYDVPGEATESTSESCFVEKKGCKKACPAFFRSCKGDCNHKPRRNGKGRYNRNVVEEEVVVNVNDNPQFMGAEEVDMTLGQ